MGNPINIHTRQSDNQHLPIIDSMTVVGAAQMRQYLNFLKVHLAWAGHDCTARELNDLMMDFGRAGLRLKQDKAFWWLLQAIVKKLPPKYLGDADISVDEADFISTIIDTIKDSCKR